MTSPVLREHWYGAEFFLSEAPGSRSRDPGQITNSGTAALSLDGGMVMTQAAYGTPTAAPKAGNTGNGTVSALATALGAIQGAYTLTFTSATQFGVTRPDGVELAPGVVGTAYSDEVAFTVAAGSVAFAAGDVITVTAPAGTGLWEPYTASTPAQNLGILWDRRTIQPGQTVDCALVVRDAEVIGYNLQWDSSVTAAGGITSAAGSDNVGNGTIGSLSILAAAPSTNGVQPYVPVGRYSIVAEDATTFIVSDPTGRILGDAVVGTPFENEIGFTLAAGSTAFSEGDAFTVLVTANGKAQALAALATKSVIARF